MIQFFWEKNILYFFGKNTKQTEKQFSKNRPILMILPQKWQIKTTFGDLDQIDTKIEKTKFFQNRSAPFSHTSYTWVISGIVGVATLSRTPVLGRVAVTAVTRPPVWIFYVAGSEMLIF